MSTNIYLTTIFLAFGTLFGVFALRYFSNVLKARELSAAQNDYRALTEQAMSALATLQSELADTRARLTKVENILKEVE
jgi:hypothetical protein